MRRVILLTLWFLAALLLATQLILPPVVEGRIEDRLEKGGGSARVSVSAFPALRLLFNDGDSLEAEGEGVRVDVRERTDALERVSGFDEVHVRLTDVVAGPLDVASFELSREDGQRDYRVQIAADTTPREVAGYLGATGGGTLGGIVGDLAAGTLPGGGDTAVPLKLDADVTSRDGQIEVTSATGSVAGLPAGPLAELLIDAVLQRL